MLLSFPKTKWVAFKGMSCDDLWRCTASTSTCNELIELIIRLEGMELL